MIRVLFVIGFAVWAGLVEGCRVEQLTTEPNVIVVGSNALTIELFSL